MAAMGRRRGPGVVGKATIGALVLVASSMSAEGFAPSLQKPGPAPISSPPSASPRRGHAVQLGGRSSPLVAPPRSAPLALRMSDEVSLAPRSQPPPPHSPCVLCS